jgi:hypothetical protein
VNKLSICTFGCVAALLSPAAAQADVPDLLGAWECEGTDVVFRSGDWSVVEPGVIEITEQRGALFTGLNHWSVTPDSDVGGHYDDELTSSASVSFLGAIDTTDNSITIVSHGDTHLFTGDLVDDNTIRFVMSESGDHAWIAIKTCWRNPG